jgi:hypothetical protein
MYVCVCMYVCVRMYAFVCVCVGVCVCVCMYYVCVCVGVCAYVCVCILCMCMYVYMYVCVCIKSELDYCYYCYCNMYGQSHLYQKRPLHLTCYSSLSSLFTFFSEHTIITFPLFLCNHIDIQDTACNLLASLMFSWTCGVWTELPLSFHHCQHCCCCTTDSNAL